jgi:hypothetical protein
MIDGLESVAAGLVVDMKEVVLVVRSRVSTVG